MGLLGAAPCSRRRLLLCATVSFLFLPRRGVEGKLGSIASRGKNVALNPSGKNHEKLETNGLSAKVTMAGIASTTTLYGSALLVYGRLFQSQIQAITLMRAFGFDRIEKAVVEARKNIRQAKRSALYNAPSLLLAAKSLSQMQDRLDGARAIMRETSKAKKNGILTDKEAKKISRLEKKHIRVLKRDMRRLKRASNSLARIWDTLDFREIVNMVRLSILLMTTCLASGHSNSMIGNAINVYARFLNVGSLLVDANRKIGFPLSRLLITRELFASDDVDNDIEEGELSRVRITGYFLTYSLSSYLVCFKKDVGQSLNSALIATSIVMRGLSSLLSVGNANKSGLLRGRGGGMLTIIFAAAAMYCGTLTDSGVLKVPGWFDPLGAVEEQVERLVTIAERVT